jgi:hypothetical protein
MGIKTVLGFSLKPVPLDPDGLSAPPDPSELAPPSGHPADDDNTSEATDAQAAEAADVSPADATDDIYAGLLPEEDGPPLSAPPASAASPLLGATRRELEPTPAFAALAEASEPPASAAHDDDPGADVAYADDAERADGSDADGALEHEPPLDAADAPFSADSHEGHEAAEDVADSAHDNSPAEAAMFPLGATRLDGLPAAALLQAQAAEDAADSVGPAVAPVRKRAALSGIGRAKNIVVAAAALSSIPLAATVVWLLMHPAHPVVSEPAPATAAAAHAALAQPAATATPTPPTAPVPVLAAESAQHGGKQTGDDDHHGATPGAPSAHAAHADAPHGEAEKVAGKAEKHSEAPASVGHSTTQTPASHAESEMPATSGACKLERMARRLARDVSPRVPLEAERLPGGEVLIGYAGTNADAHGLTLDPATLRARESFKEAGSEQVLGVVPWSKEADAPFVVDREGDEGVWRTLPGATGLALRHATKQLSLAHRGGRHAAPLWALAAETVSRPAIVAAGEQRYALALREGDERGQVRYGWLEARSQRQSPLLTLPLDAAEVGVPSLAVRDHDLLIASALRDREEGPWRIELWHAQGKAPPSRVRLPSLRQSLDDQIAPRVVAFAGGRWGLQWTTGKAGERRVDVLVLDSELNPIAEPLALSKRRTSAGAGLLIAAPPRLISLYLVQSGERYELWAQALAC